MENHTAVKVSHVSMHFNMASEKVESLKDYVIKMVKRELFFKDFVAVEDVDFEVGKGEVFGIIGTNGSGKSTLLKIIAGILTPTSGSVSVEGKIAPLIELGAGFDGDLTARENIFLNGALLGYQKEFIEEKFTSIVDFAELWDFLDMPIKNYSSGMVARMAFAIATVVKPEVLLVDEILAVGDFMFQQKCEKRIRELMAEGTTVIIVSHSIEQIESLCDRVLWIEKSQVRMIGKTYEACNAYRNMQESRHSKDVKRIVTVLQETCHACGNQTEFRMEEGAVLLREAVCKKCGCSVRVSDAARIYLEKGLGCTDSQASLTSAQALFEKKRILNCAEHGIFKEYLRHLSGYTALKGNEKERCRMLYNLPYAGETFDIILNEEMMAYFKEPEKAFLECYRVLKKDGILLLTVPLHEGKHTRFRNDPKKTVYRGEGMKVYVDWGDDICQYLERAGFWAKIYDCHKFHEEQEITDLDREFEQSLKLHPYYFYKYNSNVVLAKK